MKQKQPAKVEKRRPRVELNLVGEARARATAASRGCASLLGRLLGGTLLLTWLAFFAMQAGLR